MWDGRGERVLRRMNVDKNFLQFEHIAMKPESLPRCCHLLRQTQTGNTRTHETQNNLNEYAKRGWGGGQVKTLSLPRLATDDDETAGAATTTTTMMITDSSGQTHNYTTQHNIYLCLCLSDDSARAIENKSFAKTNKLLKIFPKDLCEPSTLLKKQG